MFGIQFGLSQVYAKNSIKNLRSNFLLGFITNLVSIPILWAINGIALDFTWFSLIMALVTAAHRIVSTFFSLGALGKVNLSLYSIFTMLGGMILPFIIGIAFFGEEITLGKILCIIIIMAAVIVPIDLKNKQSGIWYCIAVFFMNGLSGVISKLFTSLPYPKVSAAMFSLLCGFVCVVVNLIPLLLLFKQPVNLSKKSLFAAAGSGALNKTANYLLLVALMVLPASVQYPFVTGGVIIVSTIVGLVTKQKPTKKELIAMLLSFVGIAVLLLVP